VPRGTYLLVEIDGVVDEIPRPARLWPPAPARPFSLHGLNRLVEEASRDARVRGIILVLKSMRGGFATAASLRRAIARAQTAGKRVVVHLPHGGGTKETFVAMAAERVMVAPQGVLAPVGVLASTRYVRGALDRAGLIPEVHARGRYKTAAEPFERTAMSDAQREQLGAVLDRLHGALLDAIVDGRGVDRTRAGAIVDGAPYVGLEALGAGIVDAIAYEDEIPAKLAKSGAKPSVRYGEAYLRSRLALRSRALQSPGVIGVVRVHGAIAGATGLPLARMAVDERVIAAVRLARANPFVRGVVLHVDSPGGGALASDRIHHELEQLAVEKPLVACMGDVAASGGYYVSAAAHEIVAQPVTITGSIGVVAARVVLDPLLARLGIATQILQRGAHARLLDPSLPLDDEEKRAIEREIEEMYKAFVEIVARGRKRSPAEIEPLAQGRVWTGADAHRCGLVDRLGGLDDALEAVRGRIGRGAGGLRVVVLRGPRKGFPLLDPPEKKAARVVATAIEPLLRAAGLDVGVLALAGERALLWSETAASVRV
jgi:protease-4